MLNFVAEVVHQQTIGVNKTRFGVLLEAQLLIPLNQFNSTQDLVRALFSIEFMNGTATNTDVALRKAREEFLINGRSSASKVLIVVTSQSSNQSAATIQANLAKSEGVTIFFVGLGLNHNLNEVNSIASSPSSTHEITVSDFSSTEIHSTAQILSDRICAGTCIFCAYPCHADLLYIFRTVNL